MLYNYTYPQWKEEDRQFIKDAEKDMVYLINIQKKYAFDCKVREGIREVLDISITKLEEHKEEFKERYAEPYNKPSN